jgi:hypothetical protein
MYFSYIFTFETQQYKLTFNYYLIVFIINILKKTVFITQISQFLCLYVDKNPLTSIDDDVCCLLYQANEVSGTSDDWGRSSYPHTSTATAAAAQTSA